MTSALRIEFMSYPEISAAIAKGMKAVIVPCGAIEQHGPHLPLCMDSDHAEHLGELIAGRLGGTLVAPTIRVGCSAHHMTFAGTISLRPSTFEAVCRDYCESLAAHGFTRILLFSAHLGNCPILEQILPRLREAVSETCQVEAFHDSSAWLQTWRNSAATAGGNQEHVGGHADLAETSIMLVLRPDKVQLQNAEAGRIGMLTEDERRVMWREGIGGISANGILGDPRMATQAIGDRCLADIADLLVQAFTQRGER